MGFSYRMEVRERIRDELFTHLNSSYVSESNTGLNGVRISWHHLQQQMRCCGVDNYQDWYNTVQWPRNRFVPDSCCNKDLFDSDHSMQHCGQQQGADHLWYHEGCYKVFADWLMEHIQAVAILAIFFIIIELFLLSISMMLCIGMSKHKYKYHRGSRSHWNHA